MCVDSPYINNNEDESEHQRKKDSGQIVLLGLGIK